MRKRQHFFIQPQANDVILWGGEDWQAGAEHLESGRDVVLRRLWEGDERIPKLCNAERVTVQAWHFQSEIGVTRGGWWTAIAVVTLRGVQMNILIVCSWWWFCSSACQNVALGQPSRSDAFENDIRLCTFENVEKNRVRNSIKTLALDDEKQQPQALQRR